MKKDKAAVIGGKGNIGSRLVEKICRKNWNIGYILEVDGFYKSLTEKMSAPVDIYKGIDIAFVAIQTLDDGLTNPSSVSADEGAVETDFLAGKSAFAVNWLFQYSDSNDATKSQIVGQAAFAPMPVFAAGAAAGIKGSSVDGSSSFAIMATTPYADQTWKFLTYLASNEVQTKFSAEMLPVWQNDFQGDALAKLLAATPNNPVTVPAFLAQFPYANERPTVAYYNEASAALQLAIQEALTGVKTPQQALDEAAATWVSLASK